MRTKTFDSIVALLGDLQWHSALEVEERTRYADLWIDELRRESLLDTDERDGELLVRLRPERLRLDSTLYVS